MANSFWADKRVLVTGATGFIGSALVSYFQKRNAQVFAISRKQTRDSFALDVTNKKKLDAFIKKNKPHAVYHLAGETLVETGQEDPYRTFKTNMLAALNVLESCRLHSVARVIVASTVHVYTDTPIPYKEEDPPRPSRPYETSKTCADLIAQSYADAFGLPVVIPRFINIYGPGDVHFSRIIPKTIKSVLDGQPPKMWGGGAIREYLYIDDALRAYDLLGQMDEHKLERNRIFNFGTGEGISVRDLMTKIIQLSGTKLPIKKISEGRADELPIQRVSWVKARRVLGWEPRIRLTQGLTKTIMWHRRHHKTL